MMLRSWMLFALLLGWAGHAAAANVKEDWQMDDRQLQHGDFFARSIERMNTVPGFQCHFDQVMKYSDGGGQLYAGTLAVLKPKHFRWQYLQPYEQLYLGDGESIWHYEPDLMQAERLSSLESVDPAVMRLLNGTISMDEIAVLKQAADQPRHLRRFQVSIAHGPAVWLGFSADGDLVEIERQDMMGNMNRMVLSKCSYVAPAKNLFSFAPPDGVDVLDLRSANR